MRLNRICDTEDRPAIIMIHATLGDSITLTIKNKLPCIDYRGDCSSGSFVRSQIPYFRGIFFCRLLRKVLFSLTLHLNLTTC